MSLTRLLERLETTDVTALDAGGVSAGPRDVARLKGFIAGVEADFARRANTLAAAGSGLPADELLGRSQSMSRREAQRAARRADTLGEVPAMLRQLGARRIGAERLHEHSVCEYVDGTALPVATARRPACDAEIYPVVLGGDGVVLDMGRSRRLATPTSTGSFPPAADIITSPTKADGNSNSNSTRPAENSPFVSPTEPCTPAADRDSRPTTARARRRLGGDNPSTPRRHRPSARCREPARPCPG